MYSEKKQKKRRDVGGEVIQPILAPSEQQASGAVFLSPLKDEQGPAKQKSFTCS